MKSESLDSVEESKINERPSEILYNGYVKPHGVKFSPVKYPVGLLRDTCFEESLPLSST